MKDKISFTHENLPGIITITSGDTYVEWGGAGFPITSARMKLLKSVCTAIYNAAPKNANQQPTEQPK